MRHYAILSLQILFTFARSLRESLSVGAIFICFALDTRYDESETRWPTYAPYEEAMKQQWKWEAITISNVFFTVCLFFFLPHTEP